MNKCIVVLFVALVGCAHNPRKGGAEAVLEAGLYPHVYEAPAGENAMRLGSLQLTVHTLSNGGFGTNIFADVTVRNLGNEAVEFDPDAFEVVIEDTGLTYFHITKGAGSVSVPLGFNMATRTTLRPGQATRTSLWFNTPQGEAAAHRLSLHYGAAELRFPPRPGAPAAVTEAPTAASM